MFLHNLKYTIKVLFKNKGLLFWTFAFPIILGFLFNLAFKDIEKNESLKVFDIAIVDNSLEDENILFREVFDSLSKEGTEEQLFNTSYTSLEEAQSLLNGDKIEGYVVLGEKIKIHTKTSGINQTVLKTVTDEIQEQSYLYKDLISKYSTSETGEINIISIVSKINETLSKDINIKDNTSKNMSYTMIEYYTLIAMTCLYSSMLAIYSINNSLPNMSSKGLRISVSPVPKRTLVLSSLLASYLVSLIGIVLLFLFLLFVIKVDFGNKLIYIILLTLVGELAGLSMGTIIGCAFKANENAKTGIVTAFTMLGCFLSGMMGVGIKYLVDSNAKIVNLLNPASMITDGFYSLYYYEEMSRYWLNIFSILAFSLLLIIISFVILRRQKYDSI